MSEKEKIEEDVEEESRLEDDATEEAQSATLKKEEKANKKNKENPSNIMAESEQTNEKYGTKEQTQALPGIEKNLTIGSNIKDTIEGGKQQEKPNAILMAEGLKKIESKKEDTN